MFDGDLLVPLRLLAYESQAREADEREYLTVCSREHPREALEHAGLAASAAHPPGGNDHRGNDYRTLYHQLLRARHAKDHQRVTDHTEQKSAHKRADDATPSPCQGGTPDDHRSEDVEQVGRAAERRCRRGVLRQVDETSQGSPHTGKDKDPHLDALDPDP